MGGTVAGGAAGGAIGVAVGEADGVGVPVVTFGEGAGVPVEGAVLVGGLTGAGAAGCPPKQAPSNRVVPSAAAASTGRGIFMVTVLKKGPCGAPGLHLKTMPAIPRFNAGPAGEGSASPGTQPGA
ncbi:hypothetical protein OOZ51_03095 [Arthrobacter sp. MI7-26]|uniref:hypothetical protein n=1 Tax=Arthrobacter sp. MI7-26 TaxID=2993653 RepID=UPI0022496435|nr:hypothetical protein [Arthrobacter sp. MI7-26]MCX2746800.1 hypothetical protein [Arthrobacter sp. MI7-26]